MLDKLSNIFSGKKCRFCDAKLSKEPAIFKMKTAEGIVEFEICDSCTDSLEEMQKAMTRANNLYNGG